MIYGPYEAVEVWAAKRFDFVEDYIAQQKDPEYGIHDERFLHFEISISSC